MPPRNTHDGRRVRHRAQADVRWVPASPDDHPESKDQEAAARAWAAVPLRATPAFDHPPNAALDLLARYDLSGVIIWQLGFWSSPGPTFVGVWHVARQATYDYFVEQGRLLVMYYEEDSPRETGLQSGQFLDLLALFAEKRIAIPAGAGAAEIEPIVADFARRAAVVSPHAAGLNWFGESQRHT